MDNSVKARRAIAKAMLASSTAALALWLAAAQAQVPPYAYRIPIQGVDALPATPGGGGSGETDLTPLSLTLGAPLPTEAMVGYAITPVGVSAAGGTGAVARSLSGAPSWLQLGSQLSGTPDAAGSFSYAVTATAGTETKSESASMTVYGAFQAAVSGIPQGGTLTATLDQQIAPVTVTASGGKPPYALTQTGTLPNGVTFDPQTGTLSGAPTQAGSFNFGLSATESFRGASMAGSYTLSVAGSLAIEIAGTLPTEAMVGFPITPVGVSTTGGAGAVTRSLTGAPSWMQLGAQLTGTPDAAGTFTYRVGASDGATSPGQSATMTVHGAFSASVQAPANLAQGNSASIPVTATGGKAPYSYGMTGSVPGMTLVGNALTGSPSTTGTYTFTLWSQESFRGAAGRVESTHTVTVNQVEPMSAMIIGAVIENATVGEAVEPFFATATGGPGQHAFTVIDQNPGLVGTRVSDDTYSYALTPASPGTFTFRIRASDQSNPTRSATTDPVTVVVASAIAIGSPPLGGIAGQAYSHQMTATGGSGTLTFASADMPSGLSISTSGLITGTIATPQTTASFTVNASDAFGRTKSASHTITFGAAGTARPTIFDTHAGASFVPAASALNDRLDRLYDDNDGTTVSFGSTTATTLVTYRWSANQDLNCAKVRFTASGNGRLSFTAYTATGANSGTTTNNMTNLPNGTGSTVNEFTFQLTGANNNIGWMTLNTSFSSVDLKQFRPGKMSGGVCVP